MELIKEFRLTNVTVGLFSKPKWISGNSFAKFRQEWLSMFQFANGFVFPSEEFAGLKPGWAASFTVWTMK